MQPHTTKHQGGGTACRPLGVLFQTCYAILKPIFLRESSQFRATQYYTKGLISKYQVTC
jgi:hypothetical protein